MHFWICLLLGHTHQTSKHLTYYKNINQVLSPNRVEFDKNQVYIMIICSWTIPRPFQTPPYIYIYIYILFSTYTSTNHNKLILPKKQVLKFSQKYYSPIKTLLMWRRIIIF